ncbi:insulin-like growth factor-binding protein 6 [Rhineura floridana]|uniref:insulin-like growth factor-binding protein 6 n=1 Tax=Rhineura floridana TaxID=261503 RepID=UPI002AC86FB5|nr:insulin-like growth factor-binding protein 6 [Rhineura floridana]
MLLACWLETALLFLLAGATTTTGGAVLGPKGQPRPACSSPAAGCDFPARDPKALCDDKGCGVRVAGEPCGVYTPGCAPGLRCVPRPGERAPLQALLRGKGVCLAGTAKKRSGSGGSSKNQTEAGPAAGDGWEENHNAGQSTPETLPLQSQDPLQEVTIGKVQLQQLSLSSDAKQELETAPCRRHLSAILQELKAPLYFNGEDIFIPNCDTRGFYRRKQCRASKGQKRGQCWCVDKRGHQLEGLEENPLCLLANID